MSCAGETVLIFVKCPDLQNLLSFSLEVVELPFNRRGFNHSIFHRRILKCRELIFSETDIVAAPDNFSKNQVKAVIPKVRFYSLDFQEKLEKIGLKILKTGEVYPSAFQECVQYTAVAKLAPQWNIVGNLLAQGRDFLTTNDPIRAIQLDIFVNSDEISLCVKPTCIKLPHFKNQRYLTIYEDSGISKIDETCHVLPSLKQGKAISLSKTLPNTGVFENYTDLKKHWKNMYGYRLPDISEKDIWYVNIAFRVPFSITYTYPSICIRPFGMREVLRMDPQLTLQSFIGDFCKRISHICKEKCQILDLKASFPALKLYPAVEVLGETTPKIGTTYSKVQNVPYKKSIASQTNNGRQIKDLKECEIFSDNKKFQKQIKSNQGTLNTINMNLSQNYIKTIEKSNQNDVNIKRRYSEECIKQPYNKERTHSQPLVAVANRNKVTKEGTEHCNSNWNSTNNSKKLGTKVNFAESSTTLISGDIKTSQIPLEKNLPIVTSDDKTPQKYKPQFSSKNVRQRKEIAPDVSLKRRTKMPKCSSNLLAVTPDPEKVFTDKYKNDTHNFLISKLNAKVSTAYRNCNSLMDNPAPKKATNYLEDFEQKLMKNKTKSRKQVKKEALEKNSKGKTNKKPRKT